MVDLQSWSGHDLEYILQKPLASVSLCSVIHSCCDTSALYLQCSYSLAQSHFKSHLDMSFSFMGLLGENSCPQFLFTALTALGEVENRFEQIFRLVTSKLLKQLLAVSLSGIGDICLYIKQNAQNLFLHTGLHLHLMAVLFHSVFFSYFTFLRHCKAAQVFIFLSLHMMKYAM